MVLAERFAVGYDDDLFVIDWCEEFGPVTDRLIKITTALAVVAVAVVAAVISYQHADELVRSQTARQSRQTHPSAALVLKSRLPSRADIALLQRSVTLPSRDGPSSRGSAPEPAATTN
jgi:hypothetical protein